MSTAQTTNFQLETLSTLAYIFSSHEFPTLTKDLASLFQDRHCQVSFSKPPHLPPEDPDYTIFILDPDFDLGFLTTFLNQFPQAKTFLLIPPPSYQLSLPQKPNLTHIYLGEIYDCNFLKPLFAPQLYRFIFQLKQDHKLKLPGDGLFSIFPLHKSDFIQALGKIIFNPYLDQSKLLLQSLHDISLLSLAYQLRSLSPTKIELEFQPQEIPLYSQPPNSAVPFQNLISFVETTSLKDQLDCLVKFDLVPPPPPISKQKPRSKPQPKSRTRLKPLFLPTKSQSKPKTISDLRQEIEFVKLPQKKSPFRFFHWRQFGHRFWPLIKVAGLTLTLYILSLALAFFLSFVAFKRFVADFKTFQSPSKVTFAVAKPSLSYLSFNFNLLAKLPGLNQSPAFQQLKLLTNLTLHPGISLLHQAFKTTPLFLSLNHHLWGSDDQIDFDSAVKSLAQSLDFIYTDFSFLTLKLPDHLSSPFPAKVRQTYLSLLPQLNQARQQLFILKTLTPNLISILGGAGETKKYLVLLQNNNELRPTGGFIGSFATLEFDHGQLLNFQVFDVYQADGQLKGHIEPPEPIKKYLNEGSWYLRDSNWDPNFPVTAKRVEWFVHKSLKQDFDGVIALDLNFIKNLLQKLGPIKLPDYQETITADNLFERTEYHAEIKTFPGSTQKKDFLAALTNQLFLKLKTSSSVSDLFNMLSTSLVSFRSHDLMVYFNRADLNRTFDLLGWTGRLQTSSCPDNFKSQTCLADYLYLVDANLGVNKANYFVRRSIQLETFISKQKLISHQLTIHYTNTATSSEWPAGPYKNYQRLYLPYGAELKSVAIDDNDLPNSAINLERVGGKTVVGYLVQVPINKSLTVKVSYSLIKPLSGQNPLYTFYWQRQPGTSLDPLSISLHYPLFLKPRIVSPKANTSPQLLNFDLVSSQDRRILVQFSQ